MIEEKRSERAALIHFDLVSCNPTYEQLAKKIDEQLTNIEADRDFWKGRAEALEKVVNLVVLQVSLPENPLDDLAVFGLAKEALAAHRAAVDGRGK